MSREITTKLIEMMDEGLLSRESVVDACLSYMSEDDVADMAHCNGFIEEEEGDES
jgi:hypothetical protein